VDAQLSPSLTYWRTARGHCRLAGIRLWRMSVLAATRAVLGRTLDDGGGDR